MFSTTASFTYPLCVCSKTLFSVLPYDFSKFCLTVALHCFRFERLPLLFISHLKMEKLRKKLMKLNYPKLCPIPKSGSKFKNLQQKINNVISRLHCSNSVSACGNIVIVICRFHFLATEVLYFEDFGPLELKLTQNTIIFILKNYGCHQRNEYGRIIWFLL